jgi:hypothetical protein
VFQKSNLWCRGSKSVSNPKSHCAQNSNSSGCCSSWLHEVDQEERLA